MAEIGKNQEKCKGSGSVGGVVGGEVMSLNPIIYAKLET